MWFFALCWLCAVALAWPAPAAAQSASSQPAPAAPPASAASQPAPAASEELAQRSWRSAEHDALIGLPVRACEVVLRASLPPDPQEQRLLSQVSLPQVGKHMIGAPLSEALARSVMSEVLESGDFADAQALAVAEGSGVRLVIEVVARKLLADVTLVSPLAQLDEVELLREAELQKGAEISSDKLSYYRKKITQYLDRHGYPHAMVTLRFSAVPQRPKWTSLQLQVITGQVRRIARRAVMRLGERADDPLRGGATVQKAIERYSVAEGAALDQDELDLADLELRERLRALGYLQAEVAHEILPLEQNRVELRLQVRLGPLTKLRFVGNEHYDDDTLQAALELSEERDRSVGNLANKLREFYIQRGFLDAEVQARSIGTAQDFTHFLEFRVYEQRKVTVRSRRYPCFPTEQLRRAQLRAAPRTAQKIGREIDSFIEEELPGADLLRSPRPSGLAQVIGGGGAHPVDPLELEPLDTFAPDTYGRALSHVRDLYRADGYLAVEIGPLAVLRRQCDKRSPPGSCVPMPTRASDEQAMCVYDARGMPEPLPAADPSESCVPDPLRQIECAPEVDLRIPVRLGPRTYLYDVAFSGVRTQAPAQLIAAMQLQVGQPASTLKLEEARRRLLEFYREQGFPYVDAKYTLEFSLDRTRARARFEVSEGERVLVRAIVLRGLKRTHAGVLKRRIALKVCEDERTCEPYRTSLVRRTEEHIGMLGIFSSVSVSLENASTEEKWKTVVIDVVERPSKVLELRAGFSSGQGVRFGGEYGFRNIAGSALSFSVFGELSYLPTFFIKEFIRDPVLEENFVNVLGDPGFDTRTATRITASLQIPETSLGPLFRGVIDGVFVHDLQRDYYLRKFALIPALTFSPSRRLRFTIGQSLEYNSVRVFQADSLYSYLGNLADTGQLTPDRAARLLVPDGASAAFAQKLTAAWDRRDNPLDATRGTFVGLTLEHVDAVPIEDESNPQSALGMRLGRESHFLKIVQTVSGYVPIYKRLRLALSVRVGVNLQLTSDSVTYPDRLFFLGGADSMRAWYQTTFVPQDDADRIAADASKPAQIANPRAGQAGQPEYITNPDKFTERSRPVRGGNLLFNPRAELRIPLSGALETVGFVDLGNLWTDVRYPFSGNGFPLRYALGTGVRLQTPVFPIVFDIGFNPSRRYYERLWAINFAIGLF